MEKTQTVDIRVNQMEPFSQTSKDGFFNFTLDKYINIVLQRLHSLGTGRGPSTM